MWSGQRTDDGKAAPRSAGTVDPMSDRILVTGARGNVGRPLVEQLRAAGEDVAAAVVESDSNGSVHFDFTDDATWPAALDGVDRVFLLRPPPLSDVKRYIRPFIAELDRRRIRHVVFLSLMGVNRAMPHWQVEQDLKASSLGWTMLRPAFFMQNLSGPYRDDICDDDTINQPAGSGAFSFVDAADLAAVAASVLHDPAPHRGETYTLTGAHAYRYDEVASMLSAALGRPITYEPDRLLASRRAMIADGADTTYANVQLVINATARLGMASKVTADLPRLLGRPPSTLQSFVETNRDVWAC